jgi:dolichol kinase
MDIHIKRKKIKILKEIIRKSWHFFAGLVLVTGFSIITLYASEEAALITLTGALLLIMVFEQVRLDNKPRIFRVFDALFRQKEMNEVSAMVSFVTAGLIVFAVFDHWIAFTALMMLIIGDSLSAAFGMMFGKKKIKGDKTYVGMFAGLAGNLLTGAVIMWEYPLVFIPMAIVATVVEVLTTRLDDNFTIPISTAFAGYIVAMLLNISLTIY